jgi:hypothetical protein
MYTTTPPVRPFGLASAKVMSALRGDKYIVDAYPELQGAEPAEPVDSGGRPV